MADRMMLCGSIKSLGEVELDRYIAEEKFDGERIMVIKKGKEVSLLNRRGNLKEEVYIELKEEMQTLDFDFIIDGEVCSTNGLFNDLQKRALLRDTQEIAIRRNTIPIVIHIFDIIELRGENLTLEPLIKRKHILEDNFLGLKTADVCSYFEGESAILNLWAYIKEKNKEGIILKIKDSIYQYKRSNSWLKLKFVKEADLKMTKYTINNAGIRLENEDGIAVQCSGIQANYVIEQFNKSKNGNGIIVTIEYLERTKNGKYRFPAFKKIVE